MDKGMNQLLQWSIENSEATRNDPSAATGSIDERPSARSINQDAINSLFGGPSDAELMKQSIAAIESSDLSLENKLVAFDNFEQLIETIDNANNMESLGLWTPLIKQLDSTEADIRKMAAWCLGTAVQNNVKAQERMMVMGAIPALVRLALEDTSEPVRKKATYAISSEIRNYQPACDVALQLLPEEFRANEKVDAEDMDAVDKVMNSLRERKM